MYRFTARLILIGLFSFSLALSSQAQVVALLHGSGLHDYEFSSTLSFIDLATDQELLSLPCPKGIASGGLLERKHDLLITSGWDDKKRKALGTTITLFSLKNREFTRSYSQDTFYHVHHFDSQSNALYLRDWWKKLFVLNLNREPWTIEPSETPMAVPFEIPMAHLEARIDSDHWIWAKENQLMSSSDFAGTNSKTIYNHPHAIRSLYCSRQSNDKFVAIIEDNQKGRATMLFSLTTWTLQQEIPLQKGESFIHLSSSQNTYYSLDTEFDDPDQAPIVRICETSLEDGDKNLLHSFPVEPSRQSVYPVRFTRNNRFILLGLEYSRKTLPCQLAVYDLQNHQLRIKDIGLGRIHSLLELSEEAAKEFKLIP